MISVLFMSNMLKLFLQQMPIVLSSCQPVYIHLLAQMCKIKILYNKQLIKQPNIMSDLYTSRGEGRRKKNSFTYKGEPNIHYWLALYLSHLGINYVLLWSSKLLLDCISVQGLKCIHIISYQNQSAILIKQGINQMFP